MTSHADFLSPSTTAPPVTVPPASPTESGESSIPANNKLRNALHVINGEHFSGAERVQDLLALGLPDCGYQVSFATLKSGKFDEVRSSQCKLTKLEMRSRFDLGVTRRLVKAACELEAEVIHAHTPRSAMVAVQAARKLRLPFVYHVHSPTSRDSTRWWINHLNQWVESRAIRHASALVTVSGSLAQHVQKQGVDRSRIFVVRNGVAIQDPIERLEPKGDWTLGTVALFRPRKGTEVLLESLAKLRRTGANVRLLAVGGFESTEYEHSLKSLCRRLNLDDAVEWAGFCKDVGRAWRRMDLMVLPSLFGEGLPMVVLEAMAVGVPVVASSVEGVPEVIEHGVNGLTAHPNDSIDLARQIQSFLNREIDWTAVREAAMQTQRSQFSTESMSTGVAQVYDNVLER